MTPGFCGPAAFPESTTLVVAPSGQQPCLRLSQQWAVAAALPAAAPSEVVAPGFRCWAHCPHPTSVAVRLSGPHAGAAPKVTAVQNPLAVLAFPNSESFFSTSL